MVLNWLSRPFHCIIIQFIVQFLGSYRFRHVCLLSSLHPAAEKTTHRTDSFPVSQDLGDREDQFSYGDIVADLMQVEQLMQHMGKTETRAKGKRNEREEREFRTLGRERITIILSLWCQDHQRTEIKLRK